MKCDIAREPPILIEAEKDMTFDGQAKFIKNPDVTVRDAEEWDCAIVFEPETPRLSMLNATAWLIYELCDGRPFSDILMQYASLFGNKISKDEAEIQTRMGIQDLLSYRLITPVPNT